MRPNGGILVVMRPFFTMVKLVQPCRSYDIEQSRKISFVLGELGEFANLSYIHLYMNTPAAQVVNRSVFLCYAITRYRKDAGRRIWKNMVYLKVSDIAGTTNAIAEIARPAEVSYVERSRSGGMLRRPGRGEGAQSALDEGVDER